MPCPENDHEGVLARTELRGVVEEDAVHRRGRLADALQEEPVHVHAVRARDVEQAGRGRVVEQQHRALEVFVEDPHGVGLERDVGRHLERVAGIDARGEPDGAAHLARRVQGGLDRRGVGRLAVALGAERAHVEHGVAPRARLGRRRALRHRKPGRADARRRGQEFPCVHGCHV